MQNPTTTQTTPSTSALNVCEVCKQTGQYGAQWLVHIGGQKQAVHVHKPCGETLVKTAPVGVKAKVVPSRELLDLWSRQRQEKSAKSFWDSKFAQATPISKPKPALAPVAPGAVLVEAAQAA